MTQTHKSTFEWNELVDLFNLQEAKDMDSKEQEKFLERINSLSTRYGREYVMRKIVLHQVH